MTRYDLLYDPTYYTTLNKSHFSDSSPGVREYPDATVLPWRSMPSGRPGGGVCDAQGIFLDETSLHRGLGEGYAPSPEEVRICRETVIYLGMPAAVWGHCLTDNLRRLWFLFSETYRTRYAGCRLVYVPMDGFTVGESFAELLDILGADWRAFEPVTVPTKFDCVVIPDECFWCGEDGTRFFTAEYRDMIDRVRAWGEAHATPSACRKVYFTYEHSAPTKQMGEKEISAYFRAQGYEIVAPERLTFRQQLNLLVGADCFASTVGSCSHNLVFLRDGAEAVLIPRANYLTGYQLALDEVHPLSVTYIDATLSECVGRQAWNGPFFYFVSDGLRAYFHDDKAPTRAYWKRVEKAHGLYRRYARTLGQGFSGDAHRYYGAEIARLSGRVSDGDPLRRFRRVLLRYKLRLLRGLGSI